MIWQSILCDIVVALKLFAPRVVVIAVRGRNSHGQHPCK